MTTIKPTPPATGLDTPSVPRGIADVGGGAFRAAVDAPAPVATGAPTAAATAPTGSLEALVEGVARGQVDRAAALETLVQRAADSARGLTPVGRAALVEHLRATLATDPAVAALVRDLDRAT